MSRAKLGGDEGALIANLISEASEVADGLAPDERVGVLSVASDAGHEIVGIVAVLTDEDGRERPILATLVGTREQPDVIVLALDFEPLSGRVSHLSSSLLVAYLRSEVPSLANQNPQERVRTADQVMRPRGEFRESFAPDARLLSRRQHDIGSGPQRAAMRRARPRARRERRHVARSTSSADPGDDGAGPRGPVGQVDPAAMSFVFHQSS